MNKLELLAQAKPHYNESQLKTLEAAIDYAQQKHQGQTRISGEDYITHPLSVAAILIDWQLDIDSVLAAVLHDTVEDTDSTTPEIEQQFGSDVAFLVDGVTKVSRARSGMDDISKYLPKTRDNLSKFLIALSQDIRVLLIKLADRLHNLRTLEHLPEARQRKIARESIEVFAPLSDRLGMGRVKIEIEELAFSYLQPNRYRQLTAQIKKRVGRAHKQLEQVRREVAAKLRESNIDFQIDGRLKSTYSLHKKLKKVGQIDNVYDLMALRIIVDSKNDCYRVLGILHGLYQPMLAKIKDYIAAAKPNGYQSLHTTVITPSKQIIEFQIRTRQMHEFAERGLAASFHYNEQKLSKNYLRQRSVELPRNLQWIVELQELAQKVQAGELPPDGLPIDLFDDRIFAYSPRGDIFDLPEGATALDFAYAVHSEIGSHAHGARINGKMAKLGATLANGDIVEVLTRSSVRPNRDWLKIAKSTKARQKIKASLQDV